MNLDPNLELDKEYLQEKLNGTLKLSYRKNSIYFLKRMNLNVSLDTMTTQTLDT